LKFSLLHDFLATSEFVGWFDPTSFTTASAHRSPQLSVRLLNVSFPSIRA
jgi:hypothetical protein